MQSARRKYPISVYVAVLLPVLILLALAVKISSGFWSPNRDFVEYWSAARLMAAHANPYDFVATYRLERSVGYTLSTQPLLVPNPPPSLLFFAPLGYFGYGAAAAFWEVLFLPILLLCVRLLQPWSVGRAHILPVLLFPAVIHCVMAGQSTILVLLGLCLFLRLEEQRPWLAGLALTLTLLKPHLLSVFWLILLIEILRHRRFRILTGGLTGLLLTSLATLALVPHIWADYRNSLRGQNLLLRVPLPNISTELRLLLWPHGLWLQFVPLFLAVPLALWFWWRTRDRWQWHREGALLMAGAVLASPYSFHMDQVLFIPAVLYCYPRTTRLLQTVFFLLCSLGIVVIVRHPMLTSFSTVWTAPAFALWLLWAWSRQPAHRAQPAPARPELVASEP